ncbi:protein STICHEL-like 4 [Morus notabilis]|uniref:protein STICHEL-like 4 n=1 Tax=Morus notabilis TaxID=981085 RepID=UPI000CED611A|nr:protein STICHEL-like 4 [Morus notabilis]
MTKAVRDRILKEANGDISDHLRNHIHLTNCIHLKNHMHKQSPILTDRSLMRDLIVLQRSRSLRDPSASPPSWHSPSILDLLPKKGENDPFVREGRRSVGVERRREGRRLSGNSPPLVSMMKSKVAPGEIAEGNDGMVAISSSKNGARDGRRAKREESSRKSNRVDVSVNNEERPVDHDHRRDVSNDAVSGSSLSKSRKGKQKGKQHFQDVPMKDVSNDAVSGSSLSKSRKGKQKGKQHIQDVPMKTLSEQLNDVRMDSDGVASSNIHRHGRQARQEKTADEPEDGIQGYCSGLNRAKRRKFRGTRRRRAAAVGSRDINVQNELSVASNTLGQGSGHPKYHMEGEEEYDEQNVTRAPGNGCGIPWNWSRIHHRGKTFLDMAGRSFSCGLSDSRLKKGGPSGHGRDIAEMPVASANSSSSSKSNAEALPLLVDASGSQESTENGGWVRRYSGELGIYADNLFKHDVDSDLASEARSGEQRKLRGRSRSRHQNLTQKYMPRTFRDLVGQNLVAQALSNAVIRKKVGFLYVFYGPHGTGKTSCARIFARALNCQSLEHPKPCGFCNSCIAHDMGKSRNIREVGPVSNFDFERIMDLLDNMIISQLPSHYRVFIFDDCDTLSPECWSAISKVIDRAPRRVVFVLVCSSLEVGLISDEKLVDLLDLALSADTVNTVKNLRVIMETGVEPLGLMSQLATIITDLLAGSYDYTRERPRRKFFRHHPLSKEDMEKLRQALKTLSEAEKQLRTSNDKLTWLTAALLQLAPDQQYMLPSSSADTSFNQSPLALNNAGGRNAVRKAGEQDHTTNSERGLSANTRQAGTSDLYNNALMKDNSLDRKRHTGASMAPQQTSARSADTVRVNGNQVSGKSRKGIEEIWLEVLDKIQYIGIKEFLYQEGKLISVSFGAAPTVQLMFSSHLTKSTAEKFRGHILQAFQSVLGSPVTIEIRCESKKDSKAAVHVPLMLPASKDGSAQIRNANGISSEAQLLPSNSCERGKSEIVEIEASPRQMKGGERIDNQEESGKRGSKATLGVEAAPSNKKSATASLAEKQKLGEQNQCQSIVRSKVSLAHVIQQSEGCSQHIGWSRRKAVSIAEKLEQENLRLEPRSRSLLCWKASRVTRRKLSRLKIRARKPRSLLKLVSCGRCLSTKSPR